jgi:hypothetical protein
LQLLGWISSDIFLHLWAFTWKKIDRDSDDFDDDFDDERNRFGKAMPLPSLSKLTSFWADVIFSGKPPFDATLDTQYVNLLSRSHKFEDISPILNS